MRYFQSEIGLAFPSLHPQGQCSASRDPRDHRIPPANKGAHLAHRLGWQTRVARKTSVIPTRTEDPTFHESGKRLTYDQSRESTPRTADREIDSHYRPNRTEVALSWTATLSRPRTLKCQDSRPIALGRGSIQYGWPKKPDCSFR